MRALRSIRMAARMTARMVGMTSGVARRTTGTGSTSLIVGQGQPAMDFMTVHQRTQPFSSTSSVK